MRPRVGRELVRVDEDARRPHGLAAPQARRRPGRPALHPHGPRRRLPVRRVPKGRAVALRTRLVLALAYVLVLAVVALGVPLASTLADRVDTEVRSEARGQADVVAASAADFVDPLQREELQQLAGDRGARRSAGACSSSTPAATLLADSAGAALRPRRTARGPRSPAALRGRTDPARAAAPRPSTRACSPPRCRSCRDGGPAGAVRVTQSTAAVDRAVRRQWLGLALIGALVVALGLAAGWVLAGQVARPVRRLDEAARARRRGRPERPRRGRGQRRAAVAGAHVQRDDRAARPAARVPARVRRRRQPPAAHPAGRAAPAHRGRARRRPRRRARARSSTAAEREVDRLAPDGRRAARAQPRRRARAARRASSTSPTRPRAPPRAGRPRPRDRGQRVVGGGRRARRRSAPAPTSTASSTRWSRTPCTTRPPEHGRHRASRTAGRRRARRGPGHRPRRGGGGVRALPPRHGGPRAARRGTGPRACRSPASWPGAGAAT